MRVHDVSRINAEQGVALSLFEMRFRLHGHEQSGRASATTRQVRQHRGCGFPEVYAQSTLRSCAVPALRQADALSLPSVSIRGVGSGADVGAQVPTHGHLTISHRSPAHGRGKIILVPVDIP